MEPKQLNDFKNDVKKTIDEIVSFFAKIKKAGNYDCWYSQNKNAILNLFDKTEFNKDGLILRLTVIDSMYSTNINKNNYYAIPEIATAILGYADYNATVLFDKLRAYTKSDGGDDKLNDIFKHQYGVRKNKNDGSKAISLLSKYFYYHTLTCKDREHNIGFPIFDSLAKEVLWNIDSMPFSTGKLKKAKYKWVYGNNLSMPEFIKELNAVKSALGIESYDEFDAYLWRIGKLLHKSFNFDLSREDFENPETMYENQKFNILSDNENVNKHYTTLIEHLNNYYLKYINRD